MNYLDAHKIVHDYQKAFELKTDEYALIFRPISYLNGMSESNIINAYKIFYAHAVFYGSRTEEQISRYNELLRMFGVFVDDEIYHAVIKHHKENIDPSSGKLKKNITNELKHYFEMAEEVQIPSYISQEALSFYYTMRELLDKLIALAKDPIDFHKVMKITYLQTAYSYTTIEYKEEYKEGFVLFVTILRALKYDILPDSYKGYADYLRTIEANGTERRPNTPIIDVIIDFEE